MLIPRTLIFLLITLFSIKILNAQTLQLTPSNYNGYNISCFGAKNATIDLTISGGTPPYSILWSTGSTVEDLTDLDVGYYRVGVDDADTLTPPVEAEITITQPLELKIELDIHTYPNDKNISLYGACNGSINVLVLGGVGPYSFDWKDGTTTQNRSSLCAGQYYIYVTDENGCQYGEENIFLSEPERSDWQITGNSGTNSVTNFIGTIDSSDLVFRTSNTERLRITNNGSLEFKGPIKVDSASIDSLRVAYVDQAGYLRTIGPGNPTPTPGIFWKLGGNDFIDPAIHYVGTKNFADLIFKTTGFAGVPEEHMRISTSGNVSIGTSTSQPGYKLLVDGGKAGFREIFVKLNGNWPDYVFSRDYELTSLPELEESINSLGHLPGMPSTNEIEREGQNIGEIQRLQQEKVEELVLYIVHLNKSLDELKTEFENLKLDNERVKTKN